jgi:hypothetical protein
MFKTEQHIVQTFRNSSKKARFQNGTTFAKKAIVKQKITYKEITLVIGILVAMLVALTLWVQSPAEQSAIQSISLPQLTFPEFTRSLVEAAIDIFF